MLKTRNRVGIITNITIMKTRNLELQEMQTINGGGIFGGNHGSSNSSFNLGLGLSLGIESSNEYEGGRHHNNSSSSSFSLGLGLISNLGFSSNRH
jgi:hypothetical protein